MQGPARSGDFVEPPAVALDLVPENTKYDFAKDLFPRLDGSLYAMKTDCYWSDIGTLSSYYLTNNDVALNAKRFGFCI